jgi:adenylate cyclase
LEILAREKTGWKVSMQNATSDNDLEESVYLYGDPNLLLPMLNEKSSESELLLALDSLTTRFDNAAVKLAEKAKKD